MYKTNNCVYLVILDKEHEEEITTIGKEQIEQFKEDLKNIRRTYINAKN